MNSYKKLGRAESVVSGGTSIPPGQLGPSGACAGDYPSPRQQSPIQHPQPLSAAGAGGPDDRVGDTSRSFSPVSARGASQPKGKRPGKAKLTSGAGAGAVGQAWLRSGAHRAHPRPVHGATVARGTPSPWRSSPGPYRHRSGYIGARGRSAVRPTRPGDSRFRFGAGGAVGRSGPR